MTQTVESMSLLAGHLFLRAAWTKAVLTLATLPLLIAKNGIRIATLSRLSIMSIRAVSLAASITRVGSYFSF